jgi:hypothetical protein
MDLLCLARGHHRILLEPKQEEGLLHHGRPKMVLSPRSPPTLGLVARRRNRMLHWPWKSQYHLICHLHRAQPPTDHIGSRCRFRSIREVQSDWQLLRHLQ